MMGDGAVMLVATTSHERREEGFCHAAAHHAIVDVVTGLDVLAI